MPQCPDPKDGHTLALLEGAPGKRILETRQDRRDGGNWEGDKLNAYFKNIDYIRRKRRGSRKVLCIPT